jgi:response regulator RpfG family c-di-GMP phosphodiesterase
MASVLIVDDIAGNLRLVETLLAPEGHHVRTACDGAEALRMVQSAPPDLVLMDVMMPLLDGIEVCRSIKQNPRTRLIPVVLITSLNDTPSRIRGVDAGADDSIGKPFNALERDGSGYPDGLRADDIPLLAQIMGIVDVFDALTTARPYKAALSFNEAAAELRSDLARGW